MTKDVEVSKDALGWLLVWARDDKEAGVREGEPVTLPMSGDVVYFQTRRQATHAEALFNEGKHSEAFSFAM